MTLAPPCISDLALASRFLGPVTDLVIEELEDGACPGKIAVLLQCLAVATVRFDPAAEEDLAALLAEAMREAARDLASDALTSDESAS